MCQLSALTILRDVFEDIVQCHPSISDSAEIDISLDNTGEFSSNQ